jgi:hypothetical protein
MSYTLSCTRALVAALLFGAALIASQSAAEAESSSKRVRQACSSDAHRLCPREKKDSPEMRYCMEAKGRQLSRSCVRALEDDGIVPRGYFKG